MRFPVTLLFAALLSGSFTGCSSKQPPPAGKEVRISATKAFETYFGPAPTTNKGTCFGFVIYFPAAKEPGKVVPFPFFSFDEASLKKVALQRLIGGMGEKGYAADFLQLFPAGTRLLSLNEQKGALSADFSKELRAVAADPGRARALFNAVALTAGQFGGVTSVRISSEGVDLFPAQQSPPAEAGVVLQPGPPRLLKVVAMKETAAAPVTEIDALFDRPVDVEKCRFVSGDGSALQGDVFHSMFDMAAVLKPKEPGKLANTAQIKVSWQVTDKKGRSAAGEETVPLEVTVHQEAER
jgi:germination protein M